MNPTTNLPVIMSDPSPEAPVEIMHSTNSPATSAEKSSQIINISGDTVAQGIRVYQDESQRNSLSWLFHHVKDKNLSWRQACKTVDISTTTLYRVWKGEYRNPSTGDLVDISDLCDRINRYRKLVEERDGLDRPPFVETTVWTRIDKLCREALSTNTIALIYGESQIGKTAALKEHARRNNHGQTIYVLMPASGGVQSMMRAIAEECHISSRTSFDQLVERVCHFLDENKLLIIDEVHEVFVSYHKGSMSKCLSVLRQIQERTQCGLVLCGTDVFRHELERGEFSQSLKQLSKRAIWPMQLERVPKTEDLIRISAHYRLPVPDQKTAAKIREIADAFGLGKYCKFMIRAAQLAKKRGQKMTWAHFLTIYAVADELANPVANTKNN